MIRNIILLIWLFLPLFSSAQEGFLLKKVDFIGNNQIKHKELQAVTSLHSKSLFDKVQFWKKPPRFQNELLIKDINNLHKIYQSQGYIDVKVKDSLIIDNEKMCIQVFYLIKENTPTRISSFAWEVNESSQETKEDILNQLPKQKLINTHAIFTDIAVFKLIELTQNSLTNQGYAFASPKPFFDIDTIKKTVGVTINPRQGNKYTNGETYFEGLNRVPQKLLSKRLNLNAGDSYSTKKLNEAQSRAFNMQLFKYITIKPEKDSILKNVINYKIKLEELNLWDMNVGLGYGTEDKTRVQLQLTKRSFLGGIRQLDLGIKTSYFEPLNTYLKFRQPNLFADKIDFIWNPYYSQERELSYNVKRLGTNFTLERKISSKTSTFITYNIENSEIDKTSEIDETNTNIVEGSKQKNGIIWGYQYRNVNHYFNPTNGWYAQSLTSYNGLGYKAEYSYFKLLVDGRIYRPFWKQCILAARVYMGYAISTDSDQLTPIEDRFLLGGGNSIRAYQRNSISANDNNNSETIGGNSMLAMSIEARLPIYNALDGVLFGDAGNVWEKSGQYQLNDLKYGLGLGLRYNTPIGPLRIDVAAPVNDRFRMQLYLTFGHAF